MKRVSKVLMSIFILFAVIFTNDTIIEKVEAADTTYDIWDGQVDIDWYDSSNIKDSYDILNAKQLAGLAQLVNSGEDFNGVVINLTTNIDLNNIEWTPIGGSNQLEGVTFNGNGYMVKNLKVTNKFSSGLFGWIVDCQLNNLSVEGEIITRSGYAGMLAADVINTNVYQCYTSGSITMYGTDYNEYGDAVGGVIGQYYNEDENVNGYIKECGSSVTINAVTPGQYAGVIGWASTYNDSSTYEISDCYFSGVLSISDPSSATNGIGGIILSVGADFGHADLPSGNYIVKNCYVSGTVENTGDSTSALGIAIVDGTVDNCYWNSSLQIDGVQQLVWNKSKQDFDSGTGQTTNTEERTLEQMKTVEFLSTLNGGRTVWEWMIGNDGNSYPILVWQLRNYDADYTLVDEALKKVPDDLSVYTNDTVNSLNNAIDAVIRGKDASEQSIVNGYATAIESAINQLVYKDANYANVNEAINKVPKDLSIYTNKSVKVLNDALDAVILGKNITEQSIVDGYATAIENAINQLVYKEADYTKVNEAIKRVPSDLSIYTDESVKVLNAALDAVVEGKDITEQEVVDGYATAIENAIDSLKKKSIVIDGTDSNNKKNDVAIPPAGDQTNIPYLIITILLSSTIIIALSKRTKKL